MAERGRQSDVSEQHFSGEEATGKLAGNALKKSISSTEHLSVNRTVGEIWLLSQGRVFRKSPVL